MAHAGLGLDSWRAGVRGAHDSKLASWRGGLKVDEDWGLVRLAGQRAQGRTSASQWGVDRFATRGFRYEVFLSGWLTVLNCELWNCGEGIRTTL